MRDDHAKRSRARIRGSALVAATADRGLLRRLGVVTPDATIAVLLSVGYAIALFHRTAYAAIAPQIEGEFALTAAQSADLAAVFFWTYLLAMIPTGLLADAIGARRVAVAGGVATAAGAFLFRGADTAIELTLARTLIAAGAPAAFVALMRFVALTFPQRKATYSGRGILVGNVGAVCSGAPLALLLGVLAWRDIWLGAGVASLALVAALVLVGRRLQQPGRRLAPPGDPWRELSELLRSRSVLLGVALQAGLAGAYYAFANVVAPRWLAARGFDAVASGWEISLLIAGYGVGAAFWGWLGDREHQRTRALMAAGLLAMLGWIAVAVLPVRTGLAVALLFLALGLACGAFVLVYPLICEHHPAGRAGGVIACVNCGIPLGAALLSSVAGRLEPAHASWLLCAAAGVTVLGAGVLLRHRRHRAAALASSS